MPDKLPFQVGLTGGIGSGKSTVARLFQLLDVPVYESDETAKQLYFEPEIRKEVISLLGEPAYLSISELNSQWIAKEIYANPLVRVSLNEIIHPAVGRHYQNWLVQQKHPYILKVAALIFEADIYKNMDLNILVVTPEKLKIERILKRDPQRSLEQIEKIIQSQMSDSEKIKMADLLIYNDEEKSLIAQVIDLDVNVRKANF
jgi:dephospho-CoA kinase